jgi:hypothetical protein
MHQKDGRTIRRSSHTDKSTTCLHPPTKTRAKPTEDTKKGIRAVGDRSPRSHPRHLNGAVTGISVGSMGSMHTTTLTSALQRSRRK